MFQGARDDYTTGRADGWLAQLGQQLDMRERGSLSYKKGGERGIENIFISTLNP